MAELSTWTFRIKDSSGNVLANLIGANRRQIKLGLNKAGEASFSYNMKDFYDLAVKINLTVISPPKKVFITAIKSPIITNDATKRVRYINHFLILDSLACDSFT